MESYPFPTQVPTLTHEFKHGGNCEIIAIVEPDDFGPKIEVHSNVTVEGGEETKQEEEAKQKREEEEKKEAEAKQKREEEANRKKKKVSTTKKLRKNEKRKPSRKSRSRSSRNGRKKRSGKRKKPKTGRPIGAEFSYTSPAMVSQPAKFAAKVTDPNNKASPHAQYKYVWEFGDGVTAEGSGTREFRAEHAYASEGRYEVKLRSPTKAAGPQTRHTWSR